MWDSAGRVVLNCDKLRDGCYVALAEAVEGPLVTVDRRLASAPGLRCAVELV